MEIKVNKSASAATVKIFGELDHKTAPALKKKLDELIDAGVNDITLDLAALSFMDSSGIGVVLGRYNRVKGTGAIRVKNESRTVKKIFDISGLYKVVKKA